MPTLPASSASVRPSAGAVGDRLLGLALDQAHPDAGVRQCRAQQQAGMPAADDEDFDRLVLRHPRYLPQAARAVQAALQAGRGGEQVDLDRVLDPLEQGGLQLLQGAVLDLAHALLADAEAHAELLQRAAVLAQAPLVDDGALAVAQLGQGQGQPARALLAVVGAGDDLLRARALVGQEVLPGILAGGG